MWDGGELLWGWSLFDEWGGGRNAGEWFHFNPLHNWFNSLPLFV